MYRDAAPTDLCRDAAPIDLSRDAVPIDLCRDAAPIDLYRDAALIDLYRGAAPIDLSRDTTPIDLCRDTGYDASRVGRTDRVRIPQGWNAATLITGWLNLCSQTLRPTSGAFCTAWQVGKARRTKTVGFRDGVSMVLPQQEQHMTDQRRNLVSLAGGGVDPCEPSAVTSRVQCV